MQWVVENPRALVDKFKQCRTRAVIEQVRDGSTFRAFLLPDFYYITLMLSGVKVSLLFFIVHIHFADYCRKRFMSRSALLFCSQVVIFTADLNQIWRLIPRSQGRSSFVLFRIPTHRLVSILLTTTDLPEPCEVVCEDLR